MARILQPGENGRKKEEGGPVERQGVERSRRTGETRGLEIDERWKMGRKLKRSPRISSIFPRASSLSLFLFSNELLYI